VTRESIPETDADVGVPSTDPTAEVASEGGSSGDVEVGVDESPATGSEATETWHPTNRRPIEVVRDETGEGRRSP
jgi:hypothetical protein